MTSRVNGLDRPDTRFWLWVAMLTALAACLRVTGINAGLWWDEIYFLVVTVRHPLAEIVTVFPGDNQHPLYSILAWLSVHAFGEHPWSLRLPAVVFGVASVPMLYLLGVSVTSRIEALFAAALLAVSYHHVWFSQDARGYSALAFWTLLATYFLLRGIKTGRTGPYIAYAVVAALGVYTHLTMIFVVASHLLVCAGLAFSDWRRGTNSQAWKSSLKGFALAGVLILVLYAPIFLQVQSFFLHRPSRMKAVSTPMWALWEGLRSLSVGFGTVGVVAGAGLFVLGGAWSYFKQSRAVFSLLTLPVLLTALGAVLSRGTMYPRFYFSLIGFGILILARGLFVIPAWIAAHWPESPRLAPALTAILATIVLGASAFSLGRNYRYPKQDFEGAMRFIDAEKKDGDAVVTAGASTYPYREYYATHWESVETDVELRNIYQRGRPVWVVYTMPRYLHAAAPGVMDMIQKDFRTVRVFPGTLGDGDVFVGRFQPGLT